MVAARLLRPSDSVPVIGALIFPLVIQNASIILECPVFKIYPPANTAYYILLSLVSVTAITDTPSLFFDSVTLI